ncbi:unnamed protein product [Lymnaea stagnalis]|uniref:Uncharacterized protein n=1 Tax=Lymnaea stagnalis TaxID=6523 RepID=A0AAV2HHY8_LYMST
MEQSKTIIYPCRLWRHFNGHLNPEGLHLLLHRIMTYLLLHPGCPVARLCYVLNPDVLPATTAEVLDMLELIGCVHVTYIQRLPMLKMFTKRSRGQRTEGDFDLKLVDSVRTINVLVEAPIRLAYFLDLAAQRADTVSQDVTTTADPEIGESIQVTNVQELTTGRTDPKEDDIVLIIRDIPEEIQQDSTSQEVTSDGTEPSGEEVMLFTNTQVLTTDRADPWEVEAVLVTKAEDLQQAVQELTPDP